MHTTGFRALWLSSLLLSVALQTGCGMTARATREDVAHQLAGHYVYDRPLAEVWEHARQLLMDEGFALQESPETFEMVTDWRDVVSGSIARVWVRYLAVGEQIEGDRCILRFVRAEVNYVPSSWSNTKGDGGWITQMRRMLAPVAIKLQHQGAEDRASSGVTELGGRDLYMEYKLLKRVAPEVAARLEAQAGSPEAVAAYLGGPLGALSR